MSSSNYFKNESYYNSKGIDYDLSACLDYNPQEFNVDDVKKVLAVVEGERDESDWHWILELNNGKYVYLRGGCDYTGWDCQSWASSVIYDNPFTAIDNALNVPVTKENSPVFGLGRMLNILSGEFGKNDQEIFESLKRQLENIKDKTWRENKDKDMPDVPYV